MSISKNSDLKYYTGKAKSSVSAQKGNVTVCSLKGTLQSESDCFKYSSSD